MKAVILNAAPDNEVRARDAVGVLSRSLGTDCVQEFQLSKMQLGPCRSCGSCGLKTPGICIIKDDVPIILHAMANSPLLVLLTPVRFGGYSSDLKKAIDRLMTMGLPLYIVRDGHLLHPTRYENPRRLLGIGLLDDMDKDRALRESSSFCLHIERNSLNMLMDKHRAVVLPAQDEGRDTAASLEKAVEEVSC